MNAVAKFPFACFGTLTVVYLARVVWIFTQVREPIAVHFNLAGEPDRWTGRTEFILVTSALSLGVPGLLAGIALFGSKVPRDLLNLPNKDYWLAPERRDETHRRISALLSWVGCIVVVLFGVGHEGIYRLNATGSAQALRLSLPVILGATAAIVAIALVTCLRFYRVPKAE